MPGRSLLLHQAIRSKQTSLFGRGLFFWSLELIEIAPMSSQDIPEALELWRVTEGIVLRDADSPEALTRYLNRNPGLSSIARQGTEMVGVVLAGHDGRRGYLQHMAVKMAFRNLGIGRQLVTASLEAVQNEGIEKCLLFVMKANESGAEFWQHLGWDRREEIQPYSIILGSSPDA